VPRKKQAPRQPVSQAFKIFGKIAGCPPGRLSLPWRDMAGPGNMPARRSFIGYF
jgi:hypothetical protein